VLCEAPLRAASLAPPPVLSYRVYKGFLSVFEPHAGPHSLRPITIECELDVYNSLMDALWQGNVDPTTLGKRFILPSSFTDSKRYMQ
jgi:hypothetical protein